MSADISFYAHDILPNVYRVVCGRWQCDVRGPITSDMIEHLRKMADYDPAALEAQRAADIAEFERLTGTKFQ